MNLLTRARTNDNWYKTAWITLKSLRWRSLSTCSTFMCACACGIVVVSIDKHDSIATVIEQLEKFVHFRTRAILGSSLVSECTAAHVWWFGRYCVLERKMFKLICPQAANSELRVFRSCSSHLLVKDKNDATFETELNSVGRFCLNCGIIFESDRTINTFTIDQYCR